MILQQQSSIIKGNKTCEVVGLLADELTNCANYDQVSVAVK